MTWLSMIFILVCVVKQFQHNACYYFFVKVPTLLYPGKPENSNPTGHFMNGSSKTAVVVASGASATSYLATAPGTYVLRAYNTNNNSGCPQASNSITLSMTPRPTIGTLKLNKHLWCGTATITQLQAVPRASSNTAVATITNAACHYSSGRRFSYRYVY